MVKGIVKRGVTELVTPGVTFNEQVLNSKKNNFLLSFHKEKEKFGMALVDISTGEFLVAEGNLEKLLHLVHTFDPSEIIYQRTAEIPFSLQNKISKRFRNRRTKIRNYSSWSYFCVFGRRHSSRSFTAHYQNKKHSSR